MSDTLAQRRAALRLPSRAVLWAGGLLVLVVLMAVSALALRDYQEALLEERARRELLARVLEDHATRTVETAAIALSSISELLATQPHGDSTAIGPILTQSLVGLPFLRSVAVVDRQGTVLASTTPDDFGRQIDLRPLGPWPSVGRDRLGGFVPGRSLAGLARGAGSSPAVPPGVGFIPLLRHVQMRSGEGLILVALINPDAFANYQSQALDDEHAAAALASYGGDVLAATPSVGQSPGTRLAEHPAFRRYLPSIEHAGYEGRGMRAEPQIVAFRTSRTRPLVVLVEYPVSAVASGWRQDNGGFAMVAGAVVLCLLAMTTVAWRGTRSREAAHRRLDRAQAEVADREQELSITIGSVQELIFRADAEGVITFVNDRWSAIGGRAADAVGTTLADLVLPEQRTAVRAMFSREPTLGVRTAMATVVDEHDHHLLHFDVAVVPLLNDGQIVGFAGSAADVTGRVEAQQRLQTQLSVTAVMLESSPLPLSMLDVEGRYRTVNQAWEDFTGRSRAEAIGRSASGDLFADDAALHDTQDRELLARGGQIRYEARVVHRDGSRRDVVVSKVVVPGDLGDPAGILCVLMDVSEFREAERATREARDAAEEASRAKTEFIANISHELRTPLQSILGFSELGVSRGWPQDRLAAMFGEINASGKRMLALVNDLLDVAKIESTVGTFHLERTDLRPLVREVLHELSPLMVQRGVESDVRLSPAPLLAKVDPLRFQQVMRNVIANAIKFSPEQARIVVRGEATAGGDIHLSVSDQGPGIPEAEIDRVFDAFVQSSLTKDGSGGTGLGLAICRKILEVHGGRIHAENVAGGGAVFHIRLPARSAVDTGLLPLTG